MPNLPRQPVPVLGSPAQVQIADIRVLVPAGLQFRRGGCDIPRMVIRAEIVDIHHATEYIVPIDIAFAEKLHKQLGDLITEHNKQTLEK